MSMNAQRTAMRQMGSSYPTPSTSNGTSASRRNIIQFRPPLKPPSPIEQELEDEIRALSTTDEAEDSSIEEVEEHIEPSYPPPEPQEEPFLNGSIDDPPTFEDVQALIGKSGIWQLRIFLLASFSGFCTSLHNMIYGFIGITPDHWCQPPLSLADDPNITESLTSGMSKRERNCNHYAWNQVNSSLIVDNSTLVSCSSYEFDRSEFESTVATEWNLVCDDANLTVYIQVTYMVGLLIGAPIFGGVSDRLGRKYAILLATIMFIIMGPLIALAPNFIVFLVLRFILACALPGVYACSYVLAIEVISERWRSTAGNFFNIPFATGYTVLPIVAYFVRSWQTLQLICSAPSVLLIVTWFMLPESPRWLIRKGRLDEAEQILREAAVVNRTEANIPEDFSEMIKAIYEQEKESDEDASYFGSFRRAINDYLRIVKSARMRKIFLTLCFCWFIIGMTYYGLGLNSTNLSADTHTYIFIAGVLEFPGYMMVPLFIKHFGRKRVFIGFMWTCGVALLVSLLLPRGSLAIILLSYLGKLVIGANYSLVYLYSSELLPTLVRNCTLGVCSMMGRLGSTIAPFIVDIVGRDNHMYPSLIFGCLAALAGALSLLLPETQHRRLPETIEEVELGTGLKEPEKNKTFEKVEAVIMNERRR